MDCPLISVIVPVYKTEAYLERCVNSIRNQTYTNLEIILVDDGSPDRCGEMCDVFALEDSRIRVFHKENGGQSSARNLALDHMNGEFVGFVDSDDWIEPGMYQQLYNLMMNNDAQIAACGLQMDFPDGRIRYFNTAYPRVTDEELFSAMDALREVTYAQKITNSPCDKLFKRYVFDGIRMSEGKVYEDFEMMPFCLERAERIVYMPTPLYHYTMTAESTTRGIMKESYFQEGEISKERLHYYQEKYPQLSDYAMAAHVVICLKLIYVSSGIDEFASMRESLIHEMKTTVPFSAFRLLKSKHKLKFTLFMLSVNLYVIAMSAYMRQ